MEYVAQANPRPLIVQRNQDEDQVLHNVQQNNFVGHNNISNMVEQILARNGLNARLHIPKFISPLSEYVRQTELHKGWKVTKFTNIVGDTSESTVEYVTRYHTKASDIANNV